MDVNSLIAYLIPNARRWIEEQRDMHQPDSRSLLPEETKSLQRFFRAATLERARIKFVPQIENPPFYSDLTRAGYPILVDFRQMAGITFDNTILIGNSYSASQLFLSLLFHELVHVVQYGLLGVSEFTKRYVVGWAQNGFNYASIPLEREAYELQGKFDLSQDKIFSVDNIVAERMTRS